MIAETRPFGLSALVKSVMLALAVSGCARASAAELQLAEYRWQKAEVTYWIVQGAGVSDATVLDVEAALADWNGALAELALEVAVPTFTPARARKSADLLIELRVRQRRNVFGGTVGLSGSSAVKTTGCTIASANITYEGTLLGESPDGGNAIVRTAVRHRLGRILGLGEILCANPGPCTTDLMDLDYINQLLNNGIYDIDVGISDCDLLGLAVIYSAAGCEEIAASNPYTCD